MVIRPYVKCSHRRNFLYSVLVKKINKNQTKMETNIDHQSDMGHFGWEELFGGIVIPYILRENKKFCSLEIFTKHVASDFHCNLNDDELHKFDDLQIHPLTPIESYLMNEINHMHCDSLYDHKFQGGDSLVELNDINQMIRFFARLSSKVELR